jgi:quercetin 2,3-dioxygenase
VFIVVSVMKAARTNHNSDPNTVLRNMIASAMVQPNMSTKSSSHTHSTNAPVIDVRRASDRFATNAGWLDSKHSFSFGHHRDPHNTGHGLLIVNNDDVVRGGSGFDTHPHRDMEIITWVLSGELEHKDSEKNRGVLYPGLAQRMSAGTGIWHSEMNNSGTDDVHFVQMWVLPDTESIEPGYEQLDINAELATGGLVPIASGKGHDAAISIRQSGAVLYGGRLVAGEIVPVPDDRHVHVFLPRGTADIETQLGEVELLAGDAVRLSDAGGLQLTAGDDGAEVLIWATA